MPEIPAEAVQAVTRAVEAGHAEHYWSGGVERLEFTTPGLAAWLAEECEQARQEERARIAAHIRAIPEDDEPLRTATRKFIDRHPRLREGTSIVAVLLAVADEIEGDDHAE